MLLEMLGRTSYLDDPRVRDVYHAADDGTTIRN